MTIRALSADAKAPARQKAIFEAAMRPFVGVPVRLHLSSSGDPGELIDADAIWAQVVAAIQASAAALPPSDASDHRALIERTAHGLATMAPAARDAMMKAPAVALLGLGVPDLAVGESAPLAEPVETPFGPALPSTGTIRRDADRNGARRYSRDLATSAAEAARLAAELRTRAAHADPALRTQIEQQASAIEHLRLHQSGTVALSTSSGLLLASTQRTTGADPAAPNAVAPDKEHPISEQELILLP